MTPNKRMAVNAVAMLVVAGMTTAWVMAQAPARDSPAALLPPEGKGRIAGRITEREDVPVRRATITIAGDMRLTRTAITDILDAVSW